MLVQDHVVTGAIKLFKAQIASIFVEDLLDGILQFLPRAAQHAVARNVEQRDNDEAHNFIAVEAV